jgi:antitoxin (DNA-binding transcriptional repressor) of toxin-antitoxin stability system
MREAPQWTYLDRAVRLDEVATGSYFGAMRSVGLKVLKNKLSEYVRLAAAGETVLITDRDKVVAQITAPDAARSPLLADAMLADAVRSGWLTPPLGAASAGPPVSKPVARLRDLLDELDADRGER